MALLHLYLHIVVILHNNSLLLRLWDHILNNLLVITVLDLLVYLIKGIHHLIVMALHNNTLLEVCQCIMDPLINFLLIKDGLVVVHHKHHHH